MKFIVLALIVAVVVVAESSGQRPHIILPTYRTPIIHRPVIRTVRSASRDQPKWLYQGDIPRAPATGDHPVLPKFIDDVKLNPNRRYARSLDSNGQSEGDSQTAPGGTGPTHPADNIRTTRSLRTPDLTPKFPHPSPTFPKPTFDPNSFPGRQILPINSRYTRDLHFPGIKKPSHRDVVIPNWNPNARPNIFNRKQLG